MINRTPIPPDPPRTRRRKLMLLGAWMACCLVAALAVAPPASASRLWVRPSAGPGLCCEADLVSQGPDNSLWYYHSLVSNVLVPQWRASQLNGPGTTYSTPSVFVRSDGEADVVAEGPDNSLWYYHATPGNPWVPRQIGQNGTTYSAPSIFVRSGSQSPAGEADIVAEGVDHTMWYWYATPGSGWGWVHFHGAIDFSAPAILVRSSNEADIAFEGPDNSLLVYFAKPGARWTASNVAGNGSTYSAPAITAENGDGGASVQGGPEIAVEGPGYSLSYYALLWTVGPAGQLKDPTVWNGGQVGLARGITFGAPSIVDRGGGEVDLAYVGIQNSLWYYAQTDDGADQPWEVSGYNTAYG
jgi:hypothetical protein